MDYPSVCIEVLVFNFGGALLVKEDMQCPGASWKLPRIEQRKGETIQQAAERAVLGLCGIEIQAAGVVNAYDQIVDVVDETQHQVILNIEGNYLDGDFTCDNETIMAAWASGIALKSMGVDKTALTILNKVGFIDWS